MPQVLLKYTGGKSRQLGTIIPPIPDALERGGRFFEPFMGSGAVAYHVGEKKGTVQ